jgi:hypothetical protein
MARGTQGHTYCVNVTPTSILPPRGGGKKKGYRRPLRLLGLARSIFGKPEDYKNIDRYYQH